MPVWQPGWAPCARRERRDRSRQCVRGPGGAKGTGAGVSEQPRMLKCSAVVLMGLLVLQSLFKLSRHVMTLVACDKFAAKLLYVMEMLNWELVSWILSSPGRKGQEHCQVRAGIQPAQYY